MRDVERVIWCASDTLQYTVTHCNALQHVAHTARHCNTLQHRKKLLQVLCVDVDGVIWCASSTLQHTATHCNTLQHTATHCNTLQHGHPRCNCLQHTATQEKAVAGAMRDVDSVIWCATDYDGGRPRFEVCVLVRVRVCVGVCMCVRLDMNRCVPYIYMSCRVCLCSLVCLFTV